VNAAAIPTGFDWTTAAVRDALGLSAMASPGDLAHVFRGISTDSRAVEEGDLFVALEGPTFDGHDFVLDAANRGATGAVVRRIPHAVRDGFLLFPVPDTLEALGALAHYRRIRLPARVVAITGSSGKTTTKEVLRAALADSLRVHATRANLNNRVGVPLTLLEAPGDAEVVVVEVGTSEPGEIAALRAVVHPDVAVITTVAPSHAEGLGGLEGIFREKLSMLERLPPGTTVIVGDEPPELADRARTVAPANPLVVSGLSDSADQPWRGRTVEADSDGRWQVVIPGGRFVAPVPGQHGARCALLALAVADVLGVDPAAARSGLASTRLPGLRSEVRRLPGGVILADCYNANPQSVRAALAWLAAIPSAGPRVAVLGSMLELGPDGPRHHASILAGLRSGEFGSALIDVVVAVGAFAEAAEAGPTGPPGPTGTPAGSAPMVLVADDVDDVPARLRPHLAPGVTILLKGSRGMALERLIPGLETELGVASDHAAEGGG
jgi:UDP-N-acetylmuramoyl-tripeptide--D-alanyl-D-alanine ligase